MSLFDSASLVVTPSGYKEDKLYSIKPTDGSGDLVVTRATTATRVNSDGLIEQVPYNLLQRSQEFDNATWVKERITITANATTAPNGTLTADKIVEDTTTNSHRARQNTTSEQGVQYTLSYYLKASERTKARITVGGLNAFADFDLSNGTIIGTPTLCSASIIEDNNGWYRCSITYTQTSATSTTQLHLAATLNAAGDFSYLGDGVSGIFVWGAQLVSGSSAKEYFPTTDRLDVPRLDYTNSSCPSILVEPQRTNLVTYSEQFDNVAWTKEKGGVALVPVVTPNVEIAPDGTTTADRIVFSLNGGTSSSDISQLASGLFSSVSLTRTQSVYIKTTDGSTKVFSFVSPTGVATSITVTPSYQRFTYTTTGINSGTIRLRLRGAGEGTSTTASIAIWGAQYEDGSYATSYIPTIASSVTRNADVISKTGISSLIGQTEGTVLCDINLTKLSDSKTLFVIDNGTTNEYITLIRISSNIFRLRLKNSSGAAVTLIDSIVINDARCKVGIAYKNGDYAMYVNGILIGTSTNSTNYPTTALTQFVLSNTSYGFLNDSYNSVVLWKERLSNTELAQLTTI